MQDSRTVPCAPEVLLSCVLCDLSKTRAQADRCGQIACPLAIVPDTRWGAGTANTPEAGEVRLRVTDEMVELFWAAVVGPDIARSSDGAALVRGDVRQGLEAVIEGKWTWGGTQVSRGFPGALVAGARQGEDPKGAEAVGRQNGRSEAEVTPEVPSYPAELPSQAPLLSQFPAPDPARDGMRERIVAAIRLPRKPICTTAQLSELADAILPLLADERARAEAEIDLWKSTAAHEAEAYEEQRARAEGAERERDGLREQLELSELGDVAREMADEECVAEFDELRAERDALARTVADQIEWSLKLGMERDEAKAQLTAEKEAVEARVGGLERDKARLDFLDYCNGALNASYGTTYRWQMVINHNVNRLLLGSDAVDLNDSDGSNRGQPSCRGAIDRQMARVEADRKARTLLSGVSTPSSPKTEV